ncbi:ATP-binding cassette domain-containing protein [Micromonospora sp. NPDC004551]|uniref:ATP-binding cassette domain-containing protein n=1 Tax=Micromonospora sp. NPDC004551 TaxID=3154284 RepID=UPI0033B83C6F
MIQQKGLLAEFHGASLGYGPVTVLKSISMQIRVGDKIALLGASGSGKSTLLSSLAGQIPLVAGDLTFSGALSPARRPPRFDPRIAWVPHDLALVPELRAVTNVLHGCLGRLRLPRFGWHTYPKNEREAAFDLMARLGLRAFAMVPSGQLSRGQQQRVALGRALLQRPVLLVLDEPTSALDSPTAVALFRVLDDLVLQQGAVLAALHDEALARVWATRRLHASSGRIVEE